LVREWTLKGTLREKAFSHSVQGYFVQNSNAYPVIIVNYLNYNNVRLLNSIRPCMCTLQNKS